MILVTGGLGFIGSKIAAALAERGQEVRILDTRRLYNGGKPSNARRYSGKSAAQSTNFAAGPPPGEVICGDILSVAACDEACRGVDVVIHSAAIHRVPDMRRQIHAIETNVHGTLNILKSAVAAGVSRFVFLSSSKVYGEPDRLPSAEDDLPRPTIPYGLSKLVGEHYCERFREETEMDTIIVRPFSVYGPGQDLETGYIGMMIQSLMDAEEPTFPGQPSYLRDFVHIDNVVEICTRIALESGKLHAIFNAGSGSSSSLENMTKLASRLLGQRITPTYIRATGGTITRSQASFARASEICDPSQVIPIEEGLKETFEWFFKGRS